MILYIHLMFPFGMYSNEYTGLWSATKQHTTPINSLVTCSTKIGGESEQRIIDQR